MINVKNRLVFKLYAFIDSNCSKECQASDLLFQFLRLVFSFCCRTSKMFKIAVQCSSNLDIYTTQNKQDTICLPTVYFKQIFRYFSRKLSRLIKALLIMIGSLYLVVTSVVSSNFRKAKQLQQKFQFNKFTVTN